MKKKVVLCCRPEDGNEHFVGYVFSRCCEDMGYEMLRIRSAFPDCLCVDVKRGRVVNVELEFRAKNFIMHGHHKKMVSGEEYVVVCWNDEGGDRVRKLGVKVISLKEEFDFEFKRWPVVVDNKIQPVEYKILGFNRRRAGNKDFWAFSKMSVFRTNAQFKKLTKGTVIILYESGKLVGEFVVMSFGRLESAPVTEREKEIYDFLAYPVMDDEKPTSNLAPWFKTHIGYEDFKVYDPPVSFSVLNRKMSRSFINITASEYLKIQGKL